MDLLIRLKNRLRARMRTSMVGRALLQGRASAPLNSICVVSATRLSEKDFWRTSALGRSLMPWRQHPALSVDVRFRNTEGLPRHYNTHLRNEQSADILLFVHDDVWFDDPDWMSKLKLALGRYDLVGVAGNTRRVPHQPAWLFNREDSGGFVWDSEHLSGGISHGLNARGSYSSYGPAPADCLLLDGVFLAVRAAHARRSKVSFDERFDFDFYDMDLCRRAEQMGLSMGTWPIALTHQSAGEFGVGGWRAGKEAYFKKWKS